jgi:hypothetical protein
MSGVAGNPDWEEIEHAMGAFLELAEEQRGAYLSQQPAPIRAVESLMAAYRRSGSFLGDETGAPIAAADLLGRMKAMFAPAGSEDQSAVHRPEDPSPSKGPTGGAVTMPPSTNTGIGSLMPSRELSR